MNIFLAVFMAITIWLVGVQTFRELLRDSRNLHADQPECKSHEHSQEDVQLLIIGTLQLSSKYLSWQDSVSSCGTGTIATLQNTPLNSSEWSNLKLDGKGAWIGTFSKDTPFYWTRGGCFLYNETAVQDVPQRTFNPITAEKCALFCKSEAPSVKFIALQDTKCFCLDKEPEKMLQDKCKTNCTNVKNERCGSVRENSLFAYKRFTDDESGKYNVYWNRSNPQANCFAIIPENRNGNRQVSLDQANCYSGREFICQKAGEESIENTAMSFENASSYCMKKNMSLAEISVVETIKLRLRVGINYWIGLRRFTELVSVDDKNTPSETISFCIAVASNPHTVKTENCSIHMKSVCRKGQINIGTTATSTKNGNSEDKQSNQTRTKSTINFSNIITTTENQRTQQNSGSSPLGAVFGGITAVILLALIIILVLCIYKRKAKSFKRTPSYRDPQIEYSSKRKDSEFTVLNTVSNNNKVNTPPSKPVRRTKSGKGSMKGTEYENIVLELEDPKLLKKAVSQGSNGSCRVSSTKTETVDNEYSHVDARSRNRLKRNDQNQDMTSEQGNYYDSGGVPKAEASVNNIYGLGGEIESEYDVMDRENLRENEVANPDYDHMDNVLNSTDTSVS